MAAEHLPELLEHQATGRIAEIYDEIRRFSGVPYVSSLQRYLATLPGVLEWAWDAVRPAVASGSIPETGWRLARDVRIAPIGAADIALTADDRAAIRNIAANFERVSPVNLMTGACLRLLLTGTAPGGGAPSGAWTPPTMLPPMPGNRDAADMPSAERATMMRFATEVDGQPFIPALYRQLAHWSDFLAWLADRLVPRLTAPETAAARAAFRAAALREAEAVVARLPTPPRPAPDDPETVRRVLATIDRYAQTSPEMTMFGRAILEAVA